MHAAIINNQPPEVGPTPQTVQSTGQIGGRTPKAGGRLLDGHTWDQYPTLTPQHLGDHTQSAGYTGASERPA